MLQSSSYALHTGVSSFSSSSSLFFNVFIFRPLFFGADLFVDIIIH
nr:MAG TPA: hypothetical protein [Bacteriophage sp.]